MITSLQCAGFKSWQDTGSLRLARLTGFFGVNSSGKTSLLQLLLLLKQTAESTDRSQILNLGDSRSYVALGSFRDVLFQHDDAVSLRLRLAWDLAKKLSIPDPINPGKVMLTGSDIGFEAEIRSTIAEQQPEVHQLTYCFAGHRFVMTRSDTKRRGTPAYEIDAEGEPEFFRRTTSRPTTLPPPVKCYGFPDQVRASFQNAGFLSDLELEFEELWRRTFYLGPLRDYPRRLYTWAGAHPADMGPRGERAIDALLASRTHGRKQAWGQKTLEELTAKWLSELGIIRGFRLEELKEGRRLYEARVVTTKGAPEVLITDVGFGVSQILPVIVLCYYAPEGSTIILEQPEIHLHPSVQAGLADVFIDAIKKRKVQIIVESHSEHLLRRLQRRIAEEKVAAEDVSLYFCDLKGGASRARQLEVDAFGNITNWPEDFFGDEIGDLAAMTEAAIRRAKRDQRS